MPVDEDVVDRPPQRGVAPSGREGAGEVAEHGDDVGLVERATPADEVAERLRRRAAEAGEAIGRLRLLPAAVVRHPTGRREVVEGDDRRDAVLVARRAHPAVVVECGLGELALLRLDATPLDREPVRAEAELGKQRDVLGVAVVVVDGVAAGLGAAARGVVLPCPPVVVPVAALDLVGGGRRPPEEAVGERDLSHDGRP